MTTTQFWIVFLIFALGTMFTRFITFVIFPPGSTPPKEVVYLGSVLPTAAIGLIIIFALKDTVVLSYPYAIPEIIGILTVVLIQKWKRNSIISIVVGTFIYMFFVQVVF